MVNLNKEKKINKILQKQNVKGDNLFQSNFGNIMYFQLSRKKMNCYKLYESNMLMFKNRSQYTFKLLQTNYYQNIKLSTLTRRRMTYTIHIDIAIITT